MDLRYTVLIYFVLLILIDQRSCCCAAYIALLDYALSPRILVRR